LTVVLYIPAVVRRGLASVAANPYVAPRPMGEVVRALPGSLGLAWEQWNRDLPPAVAVFLLLAWAASLGRLMVVRRGCGAPTGLLLTVLGWSIAAALMQRVVPYDRVWLFALPLYAACVAEGLSAAMERLPGASPGQVAKLHSGLAVLLCLVFSFLVARGDSLSPRIWGTLHHADTMARLLKPILRPDDAVVALTPCDAPLKYEFLRHQIPVEYLYDFRIARARRLFIAVNRPAQDVPGVLAYFDIPASRFSTPRLVYDFGDSALYDMVRR
jgi:hypothetical protein